MCTIYRIIARSYRIICSENFAQFRFLNRTLSEGLKECKNKVLQQRTIHYSVLMYFHSAAKLIRSTLQQPTGVQRVPVLRYKYNT